MTPEQVQSKLAKLAELLEGLRRLQRGSLEEFLVDDRDLDAALHRLQVAIQILIDVGGHVVAFRGLGAAESSRDLLVRLEAAGAIPAGSSGRFGKIFAFRNRIVHLYDRVDAAMVFEILRDHLSDLSDLALLYAVALDGAR